MSGSLSTFSKLDNLLRTTNLTPTKFSALCKLYNIAGMSDASLNRAIQRRNFNNEVDEAVRGVVLTLEDLIARARPFPVSFADIEVTKLLLDLLNYGIDVQVGAPISVNGSSAANDSSQS
jgi:hypothetical protein